MINHVSEEGPRIVTEGRILVEKIDEVMKEFHQLVEVRIRNEILIFNKVLDLIIVVVTKGLELACFQVLHVQLVELAVLHAELFELPELSIIQNMPQRNIAHRFQLHAFQIEVEQSALEGRRQAMGVIDLEELELNVEVVWTALQSILKNAYPID